MVENMNVSEYVVQQGDPIHIALFVSTVDESAMVAVSPSNTSFVDIDAIVVFCRVVSGEHYHLIPTFSINSLTLILLNLTSQTLNVLTLN